MLRYIFSLLLGSIVILALAACGTSEKSETVNEAVTLMQEIEDNNLRTALYDAVDALNAQQGYAARLTLDTHGTNDQSSRVQLTLQVDAAQTMQVDLQRGPVTRRYAVLITPTPNMARTIIRLDTPDACIAAETSADPDTVADAWLLNDGLMSIMTEVVSALDAEQILAVIDTPDEETETPLLGRETQHHTVEARLNEALAIAREAANNATPSVPRLVDYTFTGALFLDDETAALLQLDAQYDQPAIERSAQVSFAVTQWGGIETIAPPDNLATLANCP